MCSCHLTRPEMRQTGRIIQEEYQTQLEPEGRWRIEDREAEVTSRDVWRLLKFGRKSTRFYGWTGSERECFAQLRRVKDFSSRHGYPHDTSTSGRCHLYLSRLIEMTAGLLRVFRCAYGQGVSENEVIRHWIKPLC